MHRRQQHVAQTAPIVSTFSHVQSTVTGIALIIIGALSIIFNIVDVVVGNSYSYYLTYLSTHSNGVIGHGLWCGVLVSIIFHTTSLDYLEGRF